MDPLRGPKNNNSNTDYPVQTWGEKATTTALTLATAAIGIGVFCYCRYKVAGPSEYIVRTGWRIQDVKISKQALQLPFQTVHKFHIKPSTFEIHVHAMSKQRIPFNLPSVWTIGPKDDEASLEKYVKLIMEKGEAGIKETVEGVIQGETRVLTASMDLEELFSGREKFKNDVVEKIRAVLSPFGLNIYNSNISELVDLDPKNRYFEEQKKRALQQVSQDARVAVAQSAKEGEIGEKTHKADERKQSAAIEAETLALEYKMQKEVAEAAKDLDVAKANFKKQVDIANAEAAASAEKRKFELKKEVEELNQQAEIARRRAIDLSAANVQAEIAVREAEGAARAKQIQADGDLYAKMKEAEGNIAYGKSEAEKLQKLMEAAGGPEQLMKYLLVEKDMLAKLAKTQAEAVHGMRPKVSIWNTGNSGSNVSSALTDLFKTGMPLLDGIKQQTGYDFLGSVGVKKDLKAPKDICEPPEQTIKKTPALKPLPLLSPLSGPIGI